ncbi:hypothetical protein [Nodularia sphaerocarpa]|uniref:hypothetical protein n=1 Tax=Nodularia sphaerocarpa TaxID=137816 RepID=UPI001EFBAAD2|nr:hypothetical protein [Nodularia sphaerocarpa]MDB9372803.1 hypothetical protein [Nodularia sphaerocarpa CS-585]MDB9376469.1 hypothetical protein [Nodularia sphaerocarpa CS-585A2]ULP74149.1 hypothetical protein BDGGKGIB_03812 [Nodularia sphaerocarpa UHCC 0038]
MLRDGLIKILKTIADNTDGNKLEHREVTALAYSAFNLVDEIEGISYHKDEIRFLLKALTLRAPHYSRSILAKEALYYIDKCVYFSSLETELNSEPGYCFF